MEPINPSHAVKPGVFRGWPISDNRQFWQSAEFEPIQFKVNGKSSYSSQATVATVSPCLTVAYWDVVIYPYV
jgi:hypothetical protein